MKTLVKLLVGAAVCMGSMSAQAVGYTVTNLGATANAYFDINEAGQVVSTIAGPGGLAQAALWSNGAWQTLSPGVASYAFGLNDLGHVVGSTLVNGASVATVWKNGTAQLLPGFAGEASSARDINNAGQVIGDSYRDVFFGGSLPVQWKNGQPSYLAGVESDFGYAAAINDAGKIVGGSRVTRFDTATQWTDGVPFSLEDVSSASYAWGVNQHGTVVGQSRSDQGSVGTIWSENGTVKLDAAFSELRDINDAGVAVGNANFTLGVNNLAMLYRDGAVYNLNDVIIGDRDGLGLLVGAYAINNSGLIVGLAALDGQFPGDATHAFLLTPVPEPAHWAMLLVGLGLVGVAARRKA